MTTRKDVYPNSKKIAPMRWVAFITDGPEPDTWRATAESLRGAATVEAVMCEHKHKTREAAVKCAKELASKQSVRL